MTVPNTFVNGTVANATEVNANFSAVTGSIEYGDKFNKLVELYTGSDLDFSYNNTGGSTIHDFNSISSGSLIGVTYVIIDINAVFYTGFDDGGNASISLRLQTKDIGGSFSDTFPMTVLMDITGEGNDDTGYSYLSHFKWIHALTNDEKTNGIQIRINPYGYAGADGRTTFTNRQISFWLA